MNLRLLPLLWLLAMSACSKQNPDTASALPTNTPDTLLAIQAPPIDTAMTRLALALGGMAMPGFLEPDDVSDIKGWPEHAKDCDKLWRKTDEKIPYMEKWSELYIPSKGVLFYPFAGADLLHADVFFPQVDTIIMVGLEPVGDIPRHLDILRGDTRGFFGQLRSSLSSILNYSFFLTKEMAVDFFSQLDGTLSAILHFAVRRSYLISRVHHVYIQDDGRLNTEGNGLKGSQFTLVKDGKPTIVYYFSANLMNGTMSYGGQTMTGMNSGNPLLPFLLNHQISATYLKAASYLLHNSSYSTTREYILGKSELILQDDSGIPLNYVDPDTWSIQAFGVYQGPISLFSSRYQRDLKKLYQTTDPLGLPFGIGYKLRLGTSNLQLFIRKSATNYVAPDPVVAEESPEPEYEPEKQYSRSEPAQEAEALPVAAVSTEPNESLAGAYLIGCYAIVREEEAQQLLDNLRSRNFMADYLYIPHYEPDGKRMFRVFVGPYADMDSATTVLAEVRQLIPRAYIVKMP